MLNSVKRMISYFHTIYVIGEHQLDAFLWNNLIFWSPCVFRKLTRLGRIRNSFNIKHHVDDYRGIALDGRDDGHFFYRIQDNMSE